MSPRPIDHLQIPDTLGGSPVARRVACRLYDYLRDIDAPLAAYWPLAEQLWKTDDRTDLERMRVRICLAWGIAVVAPAAAAFLNMRIDNMVALAAASRDVNHELRRATHVAGLDTPQARDLSVSYVWNAVFCAFTNGHTGPLDNAVRPLLTSGHDLLGRLIDLTPETDDAVVSTWTPVTLAIGAA